MRVIVIGGGASGSLAAAALLRRWRLDGRRDRTLDLHLVEPGRIGRGVAYSTADARHRLNVAARAMSAWPDDPGHFVDWLRAGPRPGFPEAGYAPRGLYGRYLSEVLTAETAAAGNAVAGRGRLTHHATRAVDVHRIADGARVHLAGGPAISADAVVLAIGHGAAVSGWVPAGLRSSPRFVADPWRPGALAAVPPEATVLIVGTGLTMVDVASVYHRCSVVAVSRHGLLPLPHARAQALVPTPDVPRAPLSLPEARRFVFGLVRGAGGDWRAAVDSLRPVTPTLWAALDDHARREFVALAQRRWDRVRHRMDPELADQLDARLTGSGAGSLRVRAATVATAAASGPDGTGPVDVELTDGSRVRADLVVDCTGGRVEPAVSTDPLVSTLVRRRSARPGPLGLGLATDGTGRVLSADGLPAWTLGPARRGELWESTAVPEIRAQAAAVAAAITDRAARPRPAAPPARHTHRTSHPGGRMNVEIIETPELGDRSYVVDDGDRAIVIDPQRDIDRIEDVLGRRGVQPLYVLETHVHNDYLSGGPELARRTGATYAVNAADDIAVERLELHDGSVLSAGSIRLTVIATPGHTDTHVAYLAEDGATTSGLFSGGSLLYGAVGRTDLLGVERAAELARAQFRSSHRIGRLAAPAALYPTHGFGSFCAAGDGSAASASTVGHEVATNPVFASTSEDAFAETLLASFGPYPTYYAHMAGANRRGAGPIDLRTPMPRLDAAELGRRLSAGEAVVDLRAARAYARRHLQGTISVGLGPQLSTYVGWLVPFAARVTLLADDADDLAAARRQLSRIGYDDVAGVTEPAAVPGACTGYPRRTFEELGRELHADDLVLDVRRADERRVGRLPGSRHVPLHELGARAGELPDRRIWVHCVSGYRAGIAASLLDRAGVEVVHVDDHMDRARALGMVAA